MFVCHHFGSSPAWGLADLVFSSLPVPPEFIERRLPLLVQAWWAGRVGELGLSGQGEGRLAHPPAQVEASRPAKRKSEAQLCVHPVRHTVVLNPSELRLPEGVPLLEQT